MFGQGISKAGDILDLAADLGIINKSGAWYAYEDGKIGQGRENAKQYLKENPDVAAEVEAKVREHYGLVEGNTEEDKKGAKEEKKADAKASDTKAPDMKAAEAPAAKKKKKENGVV